MKMMEETFQAAWQAIGGEALQQPLWLINSLQPYDWGTTDVLPWLLGIDNPQQQPQAEVWVGAHPKAPSQVVFPDAQFSLEQLIDGQPHAILGARAIQRFGPKLPFLFKILSAKKALSIQVHPDDERQRKDTTLSGKPKCGMLSMLLRAHSCIRDSKKK